MANDFFNKQVRTMTPKTGEGVKPLSGETQKSSLPVSSPSWPGLPGKASPDRSDGVAKPKSTVKSTI